MSSSCWCPWSRMATWEHSQPSSHTRERRIKFRRINVVERVTSLSAPKAQSLVGLHNFMGANWSRKFVWVSKRWQVTKYLKLASDDRIVQAFTRQGAEILDATRVARGRGDTSRGLTTRQICLQVIQPQQAPGVSQSLVGALLDEEPGVCDAATHPSHTSSSHSMIKLREWCALVLHNNPT